MSDKLKLCSCGGEAELKHICRISDIGWGKSYFVFWVECKECGTRAKGYNDIDFRNARELSIKSWNEG